MAFFLDSGSGITPVVMIPGCVKGPCSSINLSRAIVIYQMFTPTEDIYSIINLVNVKTKSGNTHNLSSFVNDNRNSTEIHKADEGTKSEFPLKSGEKYMYKVALTVSPEIAPLLPQPDDKGAVGATVEWSLVSNGNAITCFQINI